MCGVYAVAIGRVHACAAADPPCFSDLAPLLDYRMGQAAPDTTQQVKNTLLVSFSLPTRAQEPLQPATHVLLLDVRDEDAFRSCRSTV